MSDGPGFILAGGGSGGHIYPGLAIGERIREREAHASIVFACSGRDVDRRILEASGERFVALRAAPPGRTPARLARFLAGWGPSVRETRRLVRELHGGGRPVVLIACGGFVAAPAVQGARAERIPCVCVNLDGVPGRANTWIARRVRERLSVTPVEGPLSWRQIGPVVRRSAIAGRARAECARAWGLDDDTPILLVTGGSQGSRSINALLEHIARAHPEALGGWQVLHQAGDDDVARIERAYAEAGVRARVHDYLQDMGAAWGCAALSIGRAGAGTVAEATANGVPMLFLPYPYHADDHQRRNALPMERAGAAMIVTDLIEARRTLEADGRVLGVLADPARVEEMRRCCDALRGEDGAASVAEVAIGLCAG